MKQLAYTSINVAVSVGTLFNFVTNMENYGLWFPGVVAISSHNKLKHGTKGKIYKEIIEMPDGQHNLLIEVKETKTNEYFYTEGDLAPLLPAMQMQFKSINLEQSQLNLSYYSRNNKLDTHSELFESITENLSGRVNIAGVNLQQILSSQGIHAIQAINRQT